ncbi:ROK family transcriptional regulator [Pseudarthrobacter sp. HLT3-5]|uniref:ROK family protein n=1 Tax=Pseudarthrobacter cellobiosi TaxID=2953654 RepID=UPI00208E5797|nr:ROK family transcriptional regulator [Pseudarthrobacter sp. HLT3-5]MCO4273251.1 ROK family transcriptional regulator [Pseudarthrobacter sp. HLT3-5]
MMTGRNIPPGLGASELFQLLRDGVPRTRSQLAASTGVARSTIALRLDELLSLGMVSPVGETSSTGGRPSALVAMNPGARVVIAAQFGATQGTVALIDVGSTVISEHKETLDIGVGPVPVLIWFLDVAERLLYEAGRPESDLVAIGIGLPGPVEHESGRPKNPPIMPGWHNFDVPAFVRSRFEVPVLVDNDVNVMALGERAVAGPEADFMILVKVSTGIGSGIISEGQLQRGARGTAGDLGHIQLAAHDDALCACGNFGCLEAIAGGSAIATKLRDQGLDTHSVQDIVTAAISGNMLAIQALRQAGRDIGEVLTTCVTLFNPSLISIGGSLANAGEHLIAGIREVVYARSKPIATEHLSINRSKAGEKAGVLGAGIMAIDCALSPEGINRMSERSGANAAV